MIHKFTMHGTNIVLDVNSGTVHVVDDMTFEIIDELGKPDEEIIEKLSARYSSEEIREALIELRGLQAAGQLMSEDIYEEYLAKNPLYNEGQPIVKALCLHIAHDCNLRCRYCFASTGDFGTRRTLMPLSVAKKAIDFLIERSGTRRNLEVDFFGGEPLLNFDTVKQTVLYALEEKETGKNFRFTLTTNAVLLNEDHKRFINEYMGNVVLSLDGRPEVNDRMRCRADGRGTYSDILPKIKIWLIQEIRTTIM